MLIKKNKTKHISLWYLKTEGLPKDLPMYLSSLYLNFVPTCYFFSEDHDGLCTSFLSCTTSVLLQMSKFYMRILTACILGAANYASAVNNKSGIVLYMHAVANSWYGYPHSLNAILHLLCIFPAYVPPLPPDTYTFFCIHKLLSSSRNGRKA